MKKLILLILMIPPFLFSKAQIYTDPAVAAATGAHASVMNRQLDHVNDNLTLIQRGQLAVTGQLQIANDLQDKIYKGLSEVSSVVRSLLSIKEIASVTVDIIEDVEKAMILAKGNPVLLLFADAGAREFKTRATNLATEVGAFVLKDGKENLMDSGERAKLLNRILTEMTILRGVAYGLHRNMYWAKQRGILNSLNPYAKFINLDKKIADDVIRNSRLVKK
ncbi:hypothetical protein [Sphingobacterium siyangense]|uniref:Plasmid transfer protein n=1 Tax=Sphingobacterium siyangense TaxID=459529 RepID=A0A562M791_9SPHI|nr:hypothetical protein [Sphingobacterium siyangense]TWI15682.1 hypothetical protein IQ31_04965 [Sphingobacterium siyangense]